MESEFEKEKKYIWKKFADVEQSCNALRHELNTLQDDLPNAAKNAIQASKKTSEFRNKAEKTLSEATAILSELSDKANHFDHILGNSSEKASDISDIQKESQKQIASISSDADSLGKMLTSTEDVIADLTILVNKKPALDSAIEDIESDAEESKTNSARIKGFYGQSLEIKQELELIKDDILGYIDEDENKISGLADKLSAAYKETESSIKELKKTTSTEFEFLEKRIQQIEDGASERFEQFILERENIYDIELDKIKELMPAALTAGLSGAYEDKVKEETTELGKHKTAFEKAIKYLVIVSLLPLSTIIGRVLLGEAFVDILKDTPYLVTAMLPLYIPVFWLAYSANKNVKLSKRLIEEYTHKGVIGKTFEGLSTQIDDVKDQTTSDELKTKLLFTIISANNENPGKLISDYNKSDHPLMDALDKSTQLSDAVAKLAKIPGFSSITKTLDDKAKQLVEVQAQKVAHGLSTPEPEATFKTEPEKETA
ncbi:hypothetical protein CWO04_07800 [Vibrio splendidus]|uniref:hypothetical protein n=1 Tax=Vibrio splendidus TaxID=29497 RepID=UPI000D33F3D1|nr:hypothetical protein [Vibrio splendidus]PTP88308.1 hypothetical protein CWO04_07800 [Vibrio splendidus]